MAHAGAAVSTVPGAVATPWPAGSPWYTVQEPEPREELAPGEELGLEPGEELARAEPGTAALAVAAPAVPPAVIHSAAARPVSHPAVRTARLLSIVTD